MLYKIAILVFMVVATIGLTNGQEDCVPMAVDYVRMQPNATLTWEVLLAETCSVSSFVVYIHLAYAEEDEETLVLETDQTYADVSFLQHCFLWNFTVVAIAENNARSELRRVFLRVPLVSEADLAVDIVSVVETDAGVLLLWEPVNDACADRYRVEFAEIGSDTTRALWSFNNYVILPDVPYCAGYQFTVRAYHGSAPQREGPLASAQYNIPPGPPSLPKLLSITHGPTFINTTWALDEYSRNHCIYTSLQVTGSVGSISVTVQIQDSTARLPVDVYIQGLRPETMYVLSVVASNVAGSSRALPFAFQTMPLSPSLN